MSNDIVFVIAVFLVFGAGMLIDLKINRPTKESSDD